jgi:hypothetical protein
MYVHVNKKIIFSFLDVRINIIIQNNESILIALNLDLVENFTKRFRK